MYSYNKYGKLPSQGICDVVAMPGKRVRQPQEQGDESEPKTGDHTERTKQYTLWARQQGRCNCGVRLRPTRTRPRASRTIQAEAAENARLRASRTTPQYLSTWCPLFGLHYTTLWRLHYRGFPRVKYANRAMCNSAECAPRTQPDGIQNGLGITSDLGYYNARHRTHIYAGAILQFQTRR